MQPSTFSDQDNLRGSLWMIAAMAGFALEDSLLKLATQSLPVSQVLVIFGALGALIFYALAKIQKNPFSQMIRFLSRCAFGSFLNSRDDCFTSSLWQ
jgi:drug/metabolite transporter (DMT)-like permease